jgi:predicted type IV restriction endonuclease
LGQETEIPQTPVTVAELVESSMKGPSVVTTAEELEGYYMVRSILRPHIEASRIVHRDAQSYFAILLDDNNRKPVCRLHFNGGKKYIGFIGDDKKEGRFEIQNLDDLYQYESQLTQSIKQFDKTSG